jgi:hypothetical protein
VKLALNLMKVCEEIMCKNTTVNGGPVELAVSILVNHLEALAKLNNTEFRYVLNVSVRKGRIVYAFVCSEVADTSVLLRGFGETIEKACDDAYFDIEMACQEWGYTIPESAQI